MAATASRLIGAVTLLFKFGMDKEEDAKVRVSLDYTKDVFRKLSYTMQDSRWWTNKDQKY